MDPDKVGVVKNNMHNVPASMPNTFFYVTPGPTNRNNITSPRTDLKLQCKSAPQTAGLHSF